MSLKTGASSGSIVTSKPSPNASEDWMPQLVLFLQERVAPRFLSLQGLYDLIRSFHPECSTVQLARAVADCLEMNLFTLLTGDVLINEQATTTIEAGECAFRLMPGSVVSLQSAFEMDNVRDGVQQIIYCVVPGSPPSKPDVEIMFTEKYRFEFYKLPETFFPPHLEDDGDLFDSTKRYPCFSAEKSFLDMLYLSQLKRNCDLPSLTQFYRKTSRAKLFTLANKLGYLGRLHDYLMKYPMTTTASLDTSNAEKGRLGRKQMLEDLFLLWEKNPNMSFSELLVASRPDNASLELHKVTDQQWRDGINEFTSAV